MHEKVNKLAKARAPMIRYCSSKQLTLEEFDWPFQTTLDKHNRWVKMSQFIPWDKLAEGYYQNLSTKAGRPAKDARLVIGAMIIKHKLCLSDVETVLQIQENPYLQYFVGLPGRVTKWKPRSRHLYLLIFENAWDNRFLILYIRRLQMFTMAFKRNCNGLIILERFIAYNRGLKRNGTKSNANVY